MVWDSQGNYVERQIWTEIAGHQQVMLNAIVAEVDLTRMEAMGANVSVALTELGLTFASLPGLVGTPFTASSTGIGPTSMVPGGSALPLLFSQNLTYAVAGQNSNVSTFTFFHFLEEHELGGSGAATVVGQLRRESQIPVGRRNSHSDHAGADQHHRVQQHGTSVIFAPTVIGRRDIDLLVRPEVSKPDYTQGVQLFGFTVPAFVTRRAETRVRLRDNQTLIIAGLIQDDSTATVQKVPYLGDIPFLGLLFRQILLVPRQDRTGDGRHTGNRQAASARWRGCAAYATAGTATPEEVETRPLASPDAARPRF